MNHKFSLLVAALIIMRPFTPEVNA